MFVFVFTIVEISFPGMALTLPFHCEANMLLLSLSMRSRNTPGLALDYEFVRT